MIGTNSIALKTENFVSPKLAFAEVTCPAATNGIYINQEIYKVSRATLIDYIVITEESLSVNGAGGPGGNYAITTNAMMLNDLRVNWWVTDRARAALRTRTPFVYNNYCDGDRSYTGLATFGGGLLPEAFGNFVWKFRRPWTYRPGNSFVVEWSYPMGQAVNPGAGYPNIAAGASPQVIFHGVGQNTRHRRIFEMQLPAFNAGTTGSFAQPEFVAQLSDEAYDIDGITIVAGDSTWPDYRLYNMIRLRINPSQMEPISDDPVPIIMYGIDQGPPRRAVIYQPTGGPLLLQPGQSIGWEIDNLNAAINTNLQIGLVGRTMPRELMGK